MPVSKTLYPLVNTDTFQEYPFTLPGLLNKGIDDLSLPRNNANRIIGPTQHGLDFDLSCHTPNYTEGKMFGNILSGFTV